MSSKHVLIARSQWTCHDSISGHIQTGQSKDRRSEKGSQYIMPIDAFTQERIKASGRKRSAFQCSLMVLLPYSAVRRKDQEKKD